MQLIETELGIKPFFYHANLDEVAITRILLTKPEEQLHKLAKNRDITGIGPMNMRRFAQKMARYLLEDPYARVLTEQVFTNQTKAKDVCASEELLLPLRRLAQKMN